MSLTGSWTIVILAVLAVAAPALTIVFWNRLPSGRAIIWPARGLMLLLCQLTACLLVAGLLNDYGQFYTSWAELLGNEPGVTVHKLTPGQSEALVAQQLRAQHHKIGESAVVSLPVPEAGQARVNDALVYLPAAYFDTAYRDRLFPVVELLDGFPGSPHTWTASLHLQRIADAEIAAGRAQPFIAVLPVQNYLRVGHDGECLNVPQGTQVETTLTTNVRRAVLDAFRASEARGDWTLMGYSTGGYCALNLAMRNPQWFSTAVSIAGYTHPFEDAQTGKIFAGRPEFRDANDPLWRLEHLPVPPVSLLFLVSKPDHLPYVDVTTFARHASAPLSVSELVLARGGHNFVVWRHFIAVALDWISQHTGAPLAPALGIDGHTPQVVQPQPGHPSARPPAPAARAIRR